MFFIIHVLIKLYDINKIKINKILIYYGIKCVFSLLKMLIY